jgi:hypothetical protein
VIGADLQRKGIYATLASILGITIYIGCASGSPSPLARLRDAARRVRDAAFLFFFGYDLSPTWWQRSQRHRLLGERHHRVFDRVRDLKNKRRGRSTRHQPERQPDAEPHDHHDRHHVPRGAVLFLFGGRCSRLRLHLLVGLSAAPIRPFSSAAVPHAERQAGQGRAGLPQGLVAPPWICFPPLGVVQGLTEFLPVSPAT